MHKKEFSNYLLAHSSSLSAWVNTTLEEQLLSSFEALVRSVLGMQVRPGDRHSVRLPLRFIPEKES